MHLPGHWCCDAVRLRDSPEEKPRQIRSGHQSRPVLLQHEEFIHVQDDVRGKARVAIIQLTFLWVL